MIVLIVIGVLLKRTSRRTVFVIVPMVFMLAVTLLALVMLFFRNDFIVIRVISAFLFALAVVLIVEALRAFGGEQVTDEEDILDTSPPIPAGGKV